MAKFSLSADACETARLLARLGGSVFIPIHIWPYRAQFPSYDKHWIEALKLFLRAYAFERAGAPQSYKEGAVRALENCKDSLNTEEASEKVWDEFLRLLGPTPPNRQRNPLNPNGTHGYDAVTFCKTRVAPDDQNLYLFSLRNLRTDNVRAAHDALRQIRGIGPKIASLFLRDIALENGVTDIGLHDRHLLQPIDVWLERTTQVLTGRNLKNQKAGQQLNSLADEAGCCALRLNAGSWYFGSQVAQTEQMLRADLKNSQSVTSALERHGKAAKERAGRLLEEAGLLGAFSLEVAGYTERLLGVAGQHGAGEKPDLDKFTWHPDDVVWIKPGQTEEEAIEEAKRCRASKTKVSASKPATTKTEKPRRESLGGYLTKLLEEGGNIEQIKEKANLVAERLRLKPISVGRVRAHAKWRSRGGRYTLKTDDNGFIQIVRAT
jgi:hypothetical protein